VPKQPKWKKFRPDSTQEIEDLLSAEKRLTGYWYQRMSGQVAWMPGEKDTLMRRMDELSIQIRKAQGGAAAAWFAGLP